MNICIIQARLGSSRFPAKILQPLWGHLTALEVLYERIKKSKLVDEIIIATTSNPRDMEIVDLCNTNNYRYYIGSEDDVLQRVCDLITDFKLENDNIIDLTSDCSLICYKMLDNMLKIFNNNNYDFFSNTVTRSFYDGADIQIFKSNLLLKISDIVKNVQHRTHIGWNILNYLNELQSEFNYKLVIGNYSAKEFMPNVRLVLDHKEDLIVLKNIFNYFNRIDFTYDEIIELIKEQPFILNANKLQNSKIPGVD